MDGWFIEKQGLGLWPPLGLLVQVSKRRGMGKRVFTDTKSDCKKVGDFLVMWVGMVIFHLC